MGQSEVYEVLKNKLLSKDYSYFSAKDIQLMLNGKGISVGITSVQTNLVKLRTFGYLDMKIDPQNHKRATYPVMVYRLRKDIIN